MQAESRGQAGAGKGRTKALGWILRDVLRLPRGVLLPCPLHPRGVFTSLPDPAPSTAVGQLAPRLQVLYQPGIRPRRRPTQRLGSTSHSKSLLSPSACQRKCDCIC